MESASVSASVAGVTARVETAKSQLDTESLNRISALISECTEALNTPVIKPTNSKPSRSSLQRSSRAVKVHRDVSKRPKLLKPPVWSLSRNYSA